ncbi:hypothetical protein FACS1894116_03640 [Betaproteobacteria bacterium]|nr:hypothetical protein FACS1894116_03640 [Betaproteobacteria bacterium]GHU02327.1 hypothetical protein FACS1894154_12210 [Betaproteobacteria bacterium]GHU25355.1 hypothetical protein FACS189488_12190 [Betaproteobacteria bacterium]GHU29208.1 hypothetical protein FACS189497_06710 [Betaproteobacteria bacterium]
MACFFVNAKLARPGNPGGGSATIEYTLNNTITTLTTGGCATGLYADGPSSTGKNGAGYDAGLGRIAGLDLTRHYGADFVLPGVPQTSFSSGSEQFYFLLQQVARAGVTNKTVSISRNVNSGYSYSSAVSLPASALAGAGESVEYANYSITSSYSKQMSASPAPCYSGGNTGQAAIYTSSNYYIGSGNYTYTVANTCSIYGNVGGKAFAIIEVFES